MSTTRPPGSSGIAPASASRHQVESGPTPFNLAPSTPA
jgi:hypothetical protein